MAQKAAPAVAQAAPARAAVPVSASGVSLDDLDDIGESYDVAEDVQAATAPRMSLCPNCRSQLDSGAVLCVKCGYDTRTGKALAAPAAAKTLPYASPNRGKPQIDRMAPQGSFFKGLAMSAACAAIASLVWIGFAWVTHWTIGYIALLIGGAAGAGMKIGQDGFSAKGGTAAAGITAIAILLAKVAVIELVVVIPLSRIMPEISIFDLRGVYLGLYFFNPISLIIMVVGMAAAFRTANGSIVG
jgi:hypothetical protein